MEGDDSNDVVIIENNDETPTSLSEIQKTETRPLMVLFEQLITDDCKLTVLTNARIHSILQIDLNMDINSLHPLEISIYVNIVKRFLKDWPQWEEFDSLINRFKKVKETGSIKNVLEHKYKNLIMYLRETIDSAKPLTDKAMKKLAEEQQEPLPLLDTSDIVLEICCTRPQLNQLIFNKPHPQHNKTIFNLPSNERKATIQYFPVEAILNNPDVRFSIDLKFFTYNRQTQHELNHVLVNSILNIPEEKVVLNTYIQRKQSTATYTVCKIDDIISLINHIPKHLPQDLKLKLECVLNVVKSDFEVIDSDVIKTPGLYRQYSSKHQYFRKLYTPVESEEYLNASYDLHINETISPMHEFYIGKISQFDQSLILPDFSWLSIECLLCKVSFSNENFYEELTEHFKERHVDELDWTCCNCEKRFSMIELAYKKWRHVCEIPDKDLEVQQLFDNMMKKMYPKENNDVSSKSDNITAPSKEIEASTSGEYLKKQKKDGCNGSSLNMGESVTNKCEAKPSQSSVKHSLLVLTDKDKQCIQADKINATLWDECIAALKSGKTNFIDHVTQTFACGVCHKVPISPVTTPCVHTFCDMCLKHSKSKKAKSLFCPRCRHKLTGFKINTNVKLRAALTRILPGYGAGKK